MNRGIVSSLRARNDVNSNCTSVWEPIRTSMKPAICSWLFALALLGCGTRKATFAEHQKRTLTFVDSVRGFSFTRSTKKIAFLQLHFLNRFRDTIAIYADGQQIDTFYKDDYHYENGQPYVIHDEAPTVESRFFPWRDGKSTIEIRLQQANDGVRFDLEKKHDVYLVSWSNGHWSIVGVKSAVQ